MSVFKKRNNKETKKLPMTGKVAKGYRTYCAIVLCMAFVMCLSVTAFAAGTNDPLTVINNLSDFIFGLIRAYSARLWYRSDRSFFEVPRSFAESKRFSHTCGWCYYHLRKGNP